MATLKHNKRITITEIFSKETIRPISTNAKDKNIKKYSLYRITKMGISSDCSLFFNDISENDLFISLSNVKQNGWILGAIVKNGELFLASINPYSLDFLARIVGDLKPLYALENTYLKDEVIQS